MYHRIGCFTCVCMDRIQDKIPPPGQNLPGQNSPGITLGQNPPPLDQISPLLIVEK